MTCSWRTASAARRHRVFVEEAAHQLAVGEVRQHGAVTGEEQLRARRSGADGRRPSRVRGTRRPVRTTACRSTFSSSVRIGPPSSAAQRTRRTKSGCSSKKVNAARSIRSTWGQPCAFATLGLFDERVPIDERLEQHRAIERFLRREVMQQARTADPDLVGDLVEARSRISVVGEAPGGDLKDVILGRKFRIGGKRHIGQSTDRSVARLRLAREGADHVGELVGAAEQRGRGRGHAVVDVALDVLAALLGLAPHEQLVDDASRGSSRPRPCGRLPSRVATGPRARRRGRATRGTRRTPGTVRYDAIARLPTACTRPGVVDGQHEDARRDLLVRRRRAARPSSRRRPRAS